VLDTISDLVGKVERRARKPWITQEMISKMDERRKWKNVNTEEGRKNYRRLRNELKRATDNAKKEYLENICNEIMEFQRAGCYDLMYMTTKELGWKETQGIQNIGIEDFQGNRIVQQSQVLKIWENYITELYDRPNRPETLKVEPEEEVIMIALKKKPQATKCSDHRTISLIAHTAKIVAKILRRRTEKKIEDVLGEDQFGFRRGMGTRNAIGMLRIISERTLEIGEELCVCFIDWQKAFDRVNWTKLMQILKGTGIE